MMEEFHSRERAKQLISFKGLHYKTKHGVMKEHTDIDAFIEINGNLFVFTECKHSSAFLTRGQEWALEHICDAMSKPCIAIVCEHNINNPDEDVILADCRVRRYYYQGKWHDVYNDFKNYRMVLESIFKHHAIDYLTQAE